jgi:hypothetical protein
MSTYLAEDAASASIEAPAEDNSQTQPADEEAPDNGGQECSQTQPDKEKAGMERPRSGRMQRIHHIRDRYDDKQQKSSKKKLILNKYKLMKEKNMSRPIMLAPTVSTSHITKVYLIS